MREARKTLTETERASLIYKVVTGSEDWKLLYQLANGIQKYNSLTDKTKAKAVSTWKNSIRIVEGLKTIEYEYRRKEEEKRQQITEEIKNKIQGGGTEPTKGTTKDEITEKTNFLNLDEFLQYANQQANKIADEKEKRAWVEMIGKYMNFKESEEGETEQIKAYLPIQCYSCDLRKRCEACKFDICPVEA